MGSRLSEETTIRPKPMVEVGGRPILWHIMNIYAAHGFCEFIIALGYKGEVIKDYFLNFHAINNDCSVDLRTGVTTVHDGERLNWRVHLVDTGLHTQTGGRLLRLRDWFEPGETFMFTYGDGVADVDLSALLEFHQAHGRLASVTTVRSPARFGRIGFEGDTVVDFYEKPELSEGWINGGYFVLNAGALDYIEGEDSIWERGPIERLASEGQLMGYRHPGFWSCMDTLKEKQILEGLWQAGDPPWKIWDRARLEIDNKNSRRIRNVGVS
jgi:glucose-1-phosphate cytidylyltransferase